MWRTAASSEYRPESFKLAHVVRDLTGFDMGRRAHTAVEDARATWRLLKLQQLREAIFPAVRRGQRKGEECVTRVVAIRCASLSPSVSLCLALSHEVSSCADVAGK